MARQPRKCISGATYDIYSRCIENRFLLKTDQMKELFLKVIDETLKKYQFELNHFNILDNHFHIIIKTTNNIDTISRIMQRIKSVFAKKYNKIVGRIGPFWNERFASKILKKSKEKVSSVINKLWYSAYNSVRKKYVLDPRNYKYSSINCYLNETFKSSIPITLHECYISLGKRYKDRLEKFLKYENNFKIQN